MFRAITRIKVWNFEYILFFSVSLWILQFHVILKLQKSFFDNFHHVFWKFFFLWNYMTRTGITFCWKYWKDFLSHNCCFFNQFCKRQYNSRGTSFVGLPKAIWVFSYMIDYSSCFGVFRKLFKVHYKWVILEFLKHICYVCAI